MSHTSIEDVLKSLVCGGMSTCTVRTVDAPLSRVKMLLQNQNLAPPSHRPYKGIIDAFVRVPREQGGITSFWRGNTAMCMRAFPSYALRFTFMDNLRGVASYGLDNPTDKLPLHRQMIRGGLSGGLTMLLVYPLDQAHTRLAANVHARTQYRGVWDCLAHTTRHHGLRGNYRGLMMSVIEISPYTAIAMGGYEFLKERALTDPQSDGGFRSTATKIGVGWFSGLIASLFCYPMDTVKRQLILDGARGFVSRYDGSIRACVRAIARTDGIRGFYRGCSVNALKSAPAAGLTFCINDFYRASMGL